MHSRRNSAPPCPWGIGYRRAYYRYTGIPYTFDGVMPNISMPPCPTPALRQQSFILSYVNYDTFFLLWYYPVLPYRSTVHVRTGERARAWTPTLHCAPSVGKCQCRTARAFSVARRDSPMHSSWYWYSWYSWCSHSPSNPCCCRRCRCRCCWQQQQQMSLCAKSCSLLIPFSRALYKVQSLSS